MRETGVNIERFEFCDIPYSTTKMLSNLVIGSEKFVLFIDHNSYEPVAQKLLDKLLNGTAIYHFPKITHLPLAESNPAIDTDTELSALDKKSNVIVANVSKLELNYSVRSIVQSIHTLKRNHNVKQVFGWAATNHIRDRKLIPFLESMADIVVTLQDERTLIVLTKRITGSVFKKEYQYEINNHFDIMIREKPKSTKKPTDSAPVVDPDSLATFKINIDDDEQIARNALKLPYERGSDEGPKTSQIFYQPDSDDDFDDEDPDEDLNI